MLAGWHHWLDERESQWTPGVGDEQGGLACCDSWGRKESDTTERLIWSDLIWMYSCLENPMDGGAWWAAVHGVAKSRTRLSDFTFTFLFYVLEKEMATHSSVLAWRIPGTVAWWASVCGLPSTELQSRTQLKRLSSSSSNVHILCIENCLLPRFPTFLSHSLLLFWVSILHLK